MSARSNTEEQKPVDLDALRRLGQERAPSGVALAIEALEDPREEARLLAAQVLAAYGPALAEGARVALLQAFDEASPELAPSLAWTLVVFEERRAADGILTQLSRRAFSGVRRVDGSPAFDASRLRAFGATIAEDPALHHRYLHALGNGIGGQALLAELEHLPADSRAAFHRQSEVFSLIESLGDPRAADALFRFAESKPHVHFETRAAIALAWLGDLRAVPFLARRLGMNPLEVYSAERDWELRLRLNDSERVVSARLLAELSVLHPEELATIRSQSEDALLAWMRTSSDSHWNAFRALSAMASTKYLPDLRRWANPSVPLPKLGARPPLPEPFVIAMPALRYLGRSKDSWQILVGALQKRPANFDSTMEGSMSNGGGGAIRGMTLRALGQGAADGLSEWGDPRGFQPLLRYIEEPLNNESSRLSACAALAWVGSNQELSTLPDLIAKHAASPARASLFLEQCFEEALIERPIAGIAPKLLSFLTPDTGDVTRRKVARALAKSGIDTETEAVLLEKARGIDVPFEAALALCLGGTPAAAAKAVSSVAQQSGSGTLASLWYESLEVWTDQDLESGALFRLIENADAIGALEIEGKPQSWARAVLARQLSKLMFDDGPHTLTRVVLLHRLFALARSKKAPRAEQALGALALLRARGPLLALADEPGEIGLAAEEALAKLDQAEQSDASASEDED